MGLDDGRAVAPGVLRPPSGPLTGSPSGDLAPGHGPRRNTLFSLVSQIISATFTIGLTLFLVRELGPTTYGVLALAVSVSSIVMLTSDLGISRSAARFTAESPRGPTTRRCGPPGSAGAEVHRLDDCGSGACPARAGDCRRLRHPRAHAAAAVDRDSRSRPGDRRPLPVLVRGAGPRLARHSLCTGGELDRDDGKRLPRPARRRGGRSGRGPRDRFHGRGDPGGRARSSAWSVGAP